MAAAVLAVFIINAELWEFKPGSSAKSALQHPPIQIRNPKSKFLSL